MNPLLPKITKFISYTIVLICSLLCFQSIVLALTDMGTSSLGKLLSELLFSFLQLLPALPAVLFLKLPMAQCKTWLHWCMVVYGLNFFVAIINLLFIASTALRGGLPIVLIIWPLMVIFSIVLSLQKKSKK
jgi:hypothetical protein